MKKTIDLKLRLPKQLVTDVKYVSKNLNMSVDDLLDLGISNSIKTFAQEIAKVKKDFINSAEQKYVMNVISESDYAKRKGKAPSTELKNKRKLYKVRYLTKNSKKFAANYLVQMMKKNKGGFL